MKLLLNAAVTLIIAMNYVSCNNSDKRITEEQVSELRTYASEYMGSIKSLLISELQKGGAVSALSVCSDTAQSLTNEFALRKGIYMKRVSFKNRNPVNYPDEFETAGLLLFEEKNKEGILDGGSEHVKIVEEKGKKFIRYMKPIFISEMCLNCHGQKVNLSPEVSAILLQKYPDDKATGYSSGELRGALSIKKNL